jgi:hypothetical protein
VKYLLIVIAVLWGSFCGAVDIGFNVGVDLKATAKLPERPKQVPLIPKNFSLPSVKDIKIPIPGVDLSKNLSIGKLPAFSSPLLPQDIKTSLVDTDGIKKIKKLTKNISLSPQLQLRFDKNLSLLVNEHKISPEQLKGSLDNLVDFTAAGLSNNFLVNFFRSGLDHSAGDMIRDFVSLQHDLLREVRLINLLRKLLQASGNINNAQRLFVSLGMKNDFDRLVQPIGQHLQEMINGLLQPTLKDFLRVVQSAPLGGTIVDLVELLRGIPEKIDVDFITRPVEALHKHIDDLIRKKVQGIDRNIRVTQGTQLSSEEINFLKHRSKITTRAFKNLVGMQNLLDDQVPMISFCMSGGGYRAMVGATGFFVGAQETGLWDVTTYIACLSGGTWATFPLLLKRWSAREHQNNLVHTMFKSTSNPFLMKNVVADFEQLLDISSLVFIKFFKEEPLTILDLYGFLIGNSLYRNMFGEKTFEKTLDMLAPQYSSVKPEPLPIGTSLIVNGSRKWWFEVTPFYSGSIDLNAYVPTIVFGCPFRNGLVQEVLPPQYSGFFLGMFGSAYAANAIDIAKALRLEQQPVLGPILISDYVKKFNAMFRVTSLLEGFRPLAGLTNNYTKGLPGNLSNESYLALVDAGLDFNLPLPPLVERKERMKVSNVPNVIFICDMSDDITKKDSNGCYAGELKKAIDYFKKKNIPFPVEEDALKQDSIIKNDYTIFKSDRLMVIYIPWCSDFDCLNSWCNTFSFDYSQAQIDKLSDCLRNKLKSAVDGFVREMKKIYSEQV